MDLPRNDDGDIVISAAQALSWDIHFEESESQKDTGTLSFGDDKSVNNTCNKPVNINPVNNKPVNINPVNNKPLNINPVNIIPDTGTNTINDAENVNTGIRNNDNSVVEVVPETEDNDMTESLPLSANNKQPPGKEKIFFLNFRGPGTKFRKKYLIGNTLSGSDDIFAV